MTGESGARARVLVVDDSKLMRKAAHKMLGDEFDVVTGDDGVDAWAQIQQDPGIQVVFTDLNMPRMDGISLTRRLRENPKFQSTPILILTTESSDQMKQAGRSAGATGWLVKPFDPAKLLEVIKKVVR